MNIAKLRNQLITSIQHQVEPLLYDSGYREGPIGRSWPLRLYALKKPHRINGYLVSRIEAYTHNGIIDDAEGGACTMLHYESMPVEDLIKINNRLKSYLKCRTSSQPSQSI